MSTCHFCGDSFGGIKALQAENAQLRSQLSAAEQRVSELVAIATRIERVLSDDFELKDWTVAGLRLRDPDQAILLRELLMKLRSSDAALPEVKQ